MLPACDAVTAFGECFNYADRSRPSLDAVFARIHRALRPGGLFLFDVRTPARRAVPGRFLHVPGRDWVVLVHVTQRARSLTRAITTFRHVGGGVYRRSEEVHRLRLFSRAEVMRALRRAGFTARAWTARTLRGDHRAALTRFVAQA